jgi:hypothetical protein
VPDDETPQRSLPDPDDLKWTTRAPRDDDENERGDDGRPAEDD